jgi:hypothetical protein
VQWCGGLAVDNLESKRMDAALELQRMRARTKFRSVADWDIDFV